MRKGGSNAKGGDFERQICRLLTKWITGEEKPEIFWRSATSGAKATQDAKAGHKSKMGGDIVSIDERGQWFTDQFSVECKNRAGYGNLDQLLLKRGEFLKWWEQACKDADRADKSPLLIFKRSRGQVLIAYHVDPDIDDPGPRLIFELRYGYAQVTICSFQAWLDQNDPTEVKV